MKNKQAFFGSLIIGTVALAALLAPVLSPYNPHAIALSQELLGPSANHWLGCDPNGTDILSLLLYGARVSLEVGVVVTLASVSLGLVVGSWAGYYGGWRDSVVMRVLDIFFAFPGIILAIALAAVLGPSLGNLMLCLTASSWAGYARLARGEVMAIRNLEYVESARALGLPLPRIFIYHLWRNILSPLTVAATFGLAGTVLAEASLSFLGIGAPPGTPSWGALLSSGKDVLLEAPHVAAFPGLAILFCVLGFHLLGEGLRHRFDPRARGR